MLSLHSILISCGVHALAIALPGPGVISIVARAPGSGFRATVPMVFDTPLVMAGAGIGVAVS